MPWCQYTPQWLKASRVLYYKYSESYDGAERRECSFRTGTITESEHYTLFRFPKENRRRTRQRGWGEMGEISGHGP